MTTAKHVADFLLAIAREHGDLYTNLKLQKILYYCEAWHLAALDTSLFPDPIEAWIHGPVVPSQYRRFNQFSFNPITAKISKPAVGDKSEKLIVDVAIKYGRYSAWELERLTHSEEPWKAARVGVAPDEICHNEISKETMRDFYRHLLRVARKRT